MMSSPISLKSHSIPPASVGNSRKKELFDRYEVADEEVARAKAIYDAALEARSDIVKDIYDAFGKGPYNFRGGVTIIRRKNETKKDTTYFFRERSSIELEDV